MSQNEFKEVSKGGFVEFVERETKLGCKGFRVISKRKTGKIIAKNKTSVLVKTPSDRKKTLVYLKDITNYTT